MAIIPAKSESKSKQHAAGVRFRQRKISVKQPLTIFKQRELPSLDASELEPSQIHHLNSNTIGQPPRDIHAVETGVDKNEEEEVHLQKVINAAQKALTSSSAAAASSSSNKLSDLYIPTPDASKTWPEAGKYYKDQKFKEPESYVKFSATVEDTVGVEYNMDEEDEVFFKETLSKKLPTSKKKSETNLAKCTELEFETVCDKLEKTIETRQPFLSMDPTNILSYEEMSSYIIDQFESTIKTSNPYVESSGGNLDYLSTSTLKERLSKELNYSPFTTIFDKDQDHTPLVRPISKLLELFGRAIYEHWKNRKIKRKGRSIQPTLRFEDPNANEKDNDSDPYICFRRREFRQVRKTRRADTVGAERIRLLQKSLHRARDLIMGVCEREILNLDNLHAELDVFKLRCEAKNLKRELGIKGDDYLFFPHKKRKVVKPKEDEEEKEKRKEKKRQEAEATAKGHQQQSSSQQQQQQQHQQHQQQQQLQQQQSNQQQEGASNNQPYIKLPAAKIPDMDLVTVSNVLKEKNDTIKRAVFEKLRKRKEQDKGFVNLTDEPYEPMFDISTNDQTVEPSHIPYSSIAATNFYQLNTSNYLSESLKSLLKDSKPLPGVRTFKGENGELIPTKAFPHISSLLHEKMSNHKYNSTSYIAKLLHNIEINNFDQYTHGFVKESALEMQQDEDDNAKLSEPIFRWRKRAGRANRMFLDRRGQQTPDIVDEFFDLSNDVGDAPNVYESKLDTLKRLKSNWKFDTDLSATQKGVLEPFSLDPSHLNNISDDTQAIRFGSMLLSKSYGLLKESVQQKQQSYLQQQRMRVLQQQQQLTNRQSQQHLASSQKHNQAQQQSPPPSQQQQQQQQQHHQQAQKRLTPSQPKSSTNTVNNNPKPLSPAQNSINKPSAPRIH
ncbi:EPL1 [Candida oxycetoniae]|uniref:Enhancer of polycomb-like protein n=1 Tax=Candida oxycetoniae TaxID=497107 RepID=A0AAI9SXB8_9ASCO|nr:EPL1 [Candida oxycetoniae]KAI3404462.2 EPL1 [Candida oxycetoniae]